MLKNTTKLGDRSGLTVNKEAVTRNLRLEGILRISSDPFQLTSGIMSGVFFDTRALAMEPKLYSVILEEMDKTVAKEFGKDRYNAMAPDLVVNVPHAADYCAGRIAKKLGLPFLQLEKVGKSFGIPLGCARNLKKFKFALVADDVLTTGRSAGRIVDFLKKRLGIKTKAVFAILDRQLGARKLLKEKGVRVYTLLEMESMLRYLLAISASEQNRQNFPDTVLNKLEIKTVKREIAKIKNPHLA